MGELSLIVAVSNDGVIGFENKIPWHLSSDLKFFREKTGCCPMIMGRKTFESLPFVLPHRRHLVLTKEIGRVHPNTLVSFHSSFEEALSEAKKIPNEQGEIFVIGGETVYQTALKSCDRIYLTRILHPTEDYKGDAFFVIPDEIGCLFETETLNQPTTEPDGILWDRLLLTRV